MATAVSGCAGDPAVARTATELRLLPKDTTILDVQFLTDNQVQILSGFRDLEELYVAGWLDPSPLTDAGLETLSLLDLPHLDVLVLGPNPYITDKGLKHLNRLGGLRHLAIPACPRLTNLTLETVQNIEGIESLDARENPGFTECGLRHLKTQAHLKTILLGNRPDVYKATVKPFKSELPPSAVRASDLRGSDEVFPPRPNYGPPFMDHPNPLVHAPANLGFYVGVLVGIPVAIVALPVPRGAASSDVDAFLPMVWVGWGGATLLGGALWPLFGWWS